MAFFARLGVADAVTPVNNTDWTRELTLVDFLRDIGKHFTVNYMARVRAPSPLARRTWKSGAVSKKWRRL